MVTKTEEDSIRRPPSPPPPALRLTQICLGISGGKGASGVQEALASVLALAGPAGACTLSERTHSSLLWPSVYGAAPGMKALFILEGRVSHMRPAVARAELPFAGNTPSLEGSGFFAGARMASAVEAVA